MNLYQPHLVRIEEVIDETVDTRTLKLVFESEALRESFNFKAGQFAEYSVFGAGECTFCIASPPTRRGYVECSFKAVGKVTAAMRELGVGDVMGLRGPYGNAFPLERLEGRNVVFIAGGIGLAPVRCVIWNVLDLRDRFRDVTIVYGARSVGDLVYKRELAEWAARKDVKLWQAVDPGGQTPEWKGEVGFVPAIVEKAAPSSRDAFAVVCGPPIMIKFTLPVLKKLGFAEENIYTTLENRMKCGIGKCGRCNIGPVYVCKDGPVFTAVEVAALPPEF
ncbi:MAG TPA: FAD/NAD(P)-binding protein [Polyangiaceae bacterium]|nr:FAD/NAD(P)-binding protein [Polyangiaceae bacterium]